AADNKRIRSACGRATFRLRSRLAVRLGSRGGVWFRSSQCVRLGPPHAFPAGEGWGGPWNLCPAASVTFGALPPARVPNPRRASRIPLPHARPGRLRALHLPAVRPTEFG